MHYIEIFIRKNIHTIVVTIFTLYLFYYFKVNAVLTLLISYILLFLFLLYYSYDPSQYKKYKMVKKSNIPSDIYTYWHDVSYMPETVTKCLDSWKRHNPTYTIHIINKDNLEQYVPIDWTSMKHATTHQFKSDMIRLYVLAERGGIWMDASIYLHKSLDWIHSYQQHTKCEYVGYEQNTYSYYQGVESWFFACIPHSRFVSDWKDEFFTIHSYKSIDSYIHHLRKKGVKLDHLYNPTYLSVYASSQLLLQRKNKYSLQLLDGTGPLSMMTMWLYPFYPLFYKEPVVKYVHWTRTMMQTLGMHKFI